MVFLKLRRAWAAALLLPLLSACGSSVTLVNYVDTDTYISSNDAANHSELPYLRVSNTAGSTEERGLLKLPTGKEDSDYNFGEIFGNLSDPLTWPILPFVIIQDLFAAFFNCKGPLLTAQNLTSAYLILNVDQNPGAAPLTQITIQHLTKPWFQTVSWSQAFPFSGHGTWDQAGGDLDASFTPIAGTAPGDGTIKFDVTNYFKQLLTTTNQPHYGFVLRSANGAALSTVTFKSVQSTDSVNRPRLQSTYTCPTAQGLFSPWSAGVTAGVTAGVAADVTGPVPAPTPYTYVLGPR